MTLLEIVDRLCSVTQMQAEIIRKHKEIIEQAKIDDAVADELRQLREDVDDELDLIKYASRRYIGTGLYDNAAQSHKEAQFSL